MPQIHNQGPTRACQGRVVTTDLPTLGTSPKQIPSESATQEANDLGNLHTWGGPSAWRGGLSAGLRRTVRTVKSDHTQIAPEPPVAHLEIQTVRTLPADHPPSRDCPHLPRGPSIRPLANENQRLDGSNKRHARTRDDHEEQPAVRLLADRPQGTCGPSARRFIYSLSSSSPKSTPPSLCPISRINQGIATKSYVKVKCL
jgi:hypothetical protein